MHEVSVVADLVAAINTELERYKVVSVKEVTITVGRLTNLGAEQMEFAYEIISKGSVLEGSKLIIEEEDVKVSCGRCGYEGPVRNITLDEDSHYQMPVLSCPECGGAVTITAGKSCCVRTLEIEEAD